MSENISNQLKAVYGGGTLSVDLLKRAVDLSGVEKPKVVIAATPKQNQHTFDEYVARQAERYAELGVETQSLHNFDEAPNPEMLDWADVINISGGNTDRMMKIYQETGFGHKLKVAAELGHIVMSGVSAGAIIGFESGFSDSRSYEVPEDTPWDYIYVDGLSLVNNTVMTPHFDQPDKSALKHPNSRKGAFIDSIPRIGDNKDKTYLGLDNAAALSIHSGTIDILRSKPKAEAYQIVKHENGAVDITPFRN